MPRFADDGPLAQYFAQYPPFVPNFNVSPTSEFHRMCQILHLAQNRPAKDAAHAAFKDALTQEFNARYGTDEHNLASWQALCVRIGVAPIPDSLEECRQIVMNTHVNLVDLTMAGGRIRIFPSVHELSEYTIDTGKYFPRRNAYAGALLRHLLRQILNPGIDSDQGGSGNRGGGQRGSGGGRGGGGRGGGGGGGRTGGGRGGRGLGGGTMLGGRGAGRRGSRGS